MAWNEPGGGKKDKDPWNSGGDQGQGPDVEAFLNRLKANLNRVFGGGNGSGRSGRGTSGAPPFGLLLLGLIALWFVYDATALIDEPERGVVLRFGKYERLMTPGLNFKWPRPIESVLKVDAKQVRNESMQARMLTRDENMVLVDFNVQYQVVDPKLFLFGARDPDATLRQATESAVREVIGTSPMDTVLSPELALLATQARQRLEAALKQYETGLTVSELNLQNARPPQEVEAAFDDAIKAREDKQRIENEAEAYAIKQEPEAKGEAARILAEAEGYKASTVARADGDAARFTLLANEYRKSPAVTRKRLYLETMQGVLAENTKVVVSDRNGNNVLYLPLEKGVRSGKTSNAASDYVDRLPPVVSNPAAPLRESYRDPREAPRRSARDGDGQ